MLTVFDTPNEVFNVFKIVYVDENLPLNLYRSYFHNDNGITLPPLWNDTIFSRGHFTFDLPKETFLRVSKSYQASFPGKYYSLYLL